MAEVIYGQAAFDQRVHEAEMKRHIWSSHENDYRNGNKSSICGQEKSLYGKGLRSDEAEMFISPEALSVGLRHAPRSDSWASSARRRDCRSSDGGHAKVHDVD